MEGMESFNAGEVLRRPEFIPMSEIIIDNDEMEDMEITPDQWRVLYLFRQVTDLNDPIQLDAVRQRIQESVEADYAENSLPFDEWIEKDIEFKFKEGLEVERKNRSQGQA